MKKFLAYTTLGVASFLLGLVSAPFVLSADHVAAQEQKPSAKQETKEEAPTGRTGGGYRYVAQPGDSYSLMARKAIQTYGINNDVELSLAQILMAETSLTVEAGNPYLVEGQEVALKAANVEEWVNKAQDMGEDQEAAWAIYVKGADFNTDHVGEA